MKKIIILAFAIILTIVTYNHFHIEEQEPAAPQKDQTSISYRIEEEQNLIVDDQLDIEYTEDDLTTYINDINNEVETIVVKESLTENDENTLKNTFITLTDFIFYGGEIKGKTFNDLTTTAKESVVSLYEKIDSKIEEKIPGYKETIKETATKTYHNVKEKLLLVKADLLTSYRQEIGEENYNAQGELLEESINTMKESFSPVIDTIVDKSKDIYEGAKEKADSWYQNWKEENAQLEQ